MSAPRFCRDCIHYRYMAIFRHCARKTETVSLVTGLAINNSRDCESERLHTEPAFCGPDGRFWEGKENA